MNLRLLINLLRRVHWRLLPRAAARLAGWAWVLPFIIIGWIIGVAVYAAYAGWKAIKQGYRLAIK